MPALFTEGFFVRKPAWHGLGVVLDEFPGREEAMRLAGHDFDIVTQPVYLPSRIQEPEEDGSFEAPDTYRRAAKHKALVKRQLRAPEDCDETNGLILNITSESYREVQNSICWDIAEAIIGAKRTANYETGITLDDGKKCAITFWLDEPTQVTGDDSPIYPYGAVNWAHDGTGSIKAIRTSVRQVCANTVALAELEAERSGREFYFRHTKNVMDRIEDAKMILEGISDAHSAFMVLAEELAKQAVTEEGREFFISQFIPSPPEALVSARVAENIEQARAVVRRILTEGQTIPDAHRLTSYGLLTAGVEYLDHLRGYRNQSTYVGRTLLRQEPLKAKLLPLIKEAATL